MAAPTTDATPGDTALLAAARGGDGRAFERLVAPHRRALHVHCYRMLGSVDDADDALQETLLRAWRGLGRYEARSRLAAWLYRIATNVCLRMIERRRLPGRERLGPAESAVAGYLQPYPDLLLDELPSAEPGPEPITVERESVALALVAALQLLPPRQRAAIVLREGLGWSAREIADATGDSVASVTSALQRARERLDRERRAGALARDHVPAPRAAEGAVLARFLAAWEAVDTDAIVRLLADDAVLTMPPEPMRIVGARAIGEFFRTVPAQGALERIRLVETRSNGQPALAAYWAQDDGVYRAYGLMVFSLDGDRVAGITGFAGFPELIVRHGLPAELA